MSKKKIFNYIVYCHTNILNQKSYVGWATVYDNQTPQDAMIRRLNEHRTKASFNSKRHFFLALNCYSFDVWKHEILEITPSLVDIKTAEKFWINQKKSFTNGYNMTTGGDGVGGYVHSEESRRKNSAAHKGLIKSPQHILNLKISNTGKKRSKETRQRISDSKRGNKHPWKGKHLPLKTRQQISLNQPNRRSVCQFTKKGKLIAVYSSTVDAQNATNIPATNVVKCCKQLLKTTGGFCWKYEYE